MKIQKYPCTESIELFYSRVALVIFLWIKKCNYQNNHVQFLKDITSWWKNHLTLKAKTKDKMIKGQNNNYVIIINSNLYLRT